MGTILELNGIKKYYGKKEVLKGISLQVEEGQVISVLGPSGCGKSTLFKHHRWNSFRWMREVSESMEKKYLPMEK